ncbi:sensor histidine kinase [Phycicoccus avicenniae]|uniref:sensor histidine kinase n=1 Tax=Phycicoccus avicenniae TaxID=2828860 RepID=UPI003D2AFF1F
MDPTTAPSDATDRTGGGGILAPATGLDAWLRAVLVVLTVTCAVRYLVRHDFDAAGLGVLVGAVALVAAYSMRGRLPQGPSWPTAWLVAVVALWAALTVLAPSFAWTVVPLAFAALQVLPFRYAVGTVALMTLVVCLAWLRITDGLDPTLVAGPAGMALITVLGYRALEREAAVRQALLDDLRAAQSDLAVAQHRAGALTERTRLSRDIHDSVGQGLSSINLLLNAADEDWDRRPGQARDHVRRAASTAREGLDEVRRVVRDLAPARLDEDTSAEALHSALDGVLAQAPPSVDVSLRVDGSARPVPDPVSTALVRTARGALANVYEHSGAGRAVVTLTYQHAEVLLDVRDDGRGFDPQRPRARGARGTGLRGIRERVSLLGGRTAVESARGEGTTVSVAVPAPPVS